MRISHKFLPKLFLLLTPSRRGNAGDKIYEHIFRSLRITSLSSLEVGVLFLCTNTILWMERHPKQEKKINVEIYGIRKVLCSSRCNMFSQLGICVRRAVGSGTSGEAGTERAIPDGIKFIPHVVTGGRGAKSSFSHRRFG